MTVSNTVASVTYDGDGSTTAFPTTFVFSTSADIEVIERVIATGAETTKTLTTDYTVAGGGGAGNTPATGTVNAVSAPASTVQWTIRRVVAETQGTALPVAGSLPSKAVELMVDRSTLMIQQHSEELGRSLQFPKTDANTLDSTIPSSVDRASKLLAFTSDGTPTVRDLSDGGTGTMSNLVEDETPQLGGTLDTNGKQVRWSKGADIASAAALTLGTDGNYFDVTGTTTITSIGALAVGTVVGLHFDGALTLTHNATDLILPGGANITTVAGDEFTFVEYASGDWRCVAYALASGRAAVETEASLPRSYLAGLQLSNAADASHDIAFAVGECRSTDDSDDLVLASAQTKQIDATWATGTNAGGLSSSLTAPANNTWYHCFIFKVGSTVECGFDTSVSAANLVTDHSALTPRRVGSVLTDGSANIIAFTQVGDDFWWDATKADLTNGSVSTSGTTITLTVPTGLKVHAHFNASMGTHDRQALTFYSPDITGGQPSATSVPVPHANGTGENTTQAYVLTNTSAQVTARAGGALSDASVSTLGWRDTRGRDD